ncbi:protein-disulfide reductase DsbD domain-containing protein [Actibacterium lipolyticum]|nr:protein-disulfide reductase DsbD domain-containing protein [Actibacterium lipolyticum]
MKRFLTQLVLATGLTLPTLSPAFAGSEYDDVVTAEILPGWETDSGAQIVGLRLMLAPGWKTYWRAPGDAGIPPQFDWSGSSNIRSATYHWPRPDVFYQNGMRAIGYKNELVLPIELTPSSPGQPITINGNVALGVCLDICMPIELELRATLPAQADPAPINAALAQRPISAKSAGVGKVTCTVEPIADGLRLTTRISVAPMGGKEVAVIELPDPSIWIAEANVTREGRDLVAVTEMVPENAAPFALDRSKVRVTLLSGKKAIDIQGCTGS